MKSSDVNWDDPDVAEAIARGELLMCTYPDVTVYRVLGRNGQGLLEGRVLVEQGEQQADGPVRSFADGQEDVVFRTTTMKRVGHGEQVLCHTSEGFLFGTFHCAAEGSFIDFGSPEANPSISTYTIFAVLRPPKPAE